MPDFFPADYPIKNHLKTPIISCIMNFREQRFFVSSRSKKPVLPQLQQKAVH
jgi:hypothetical protein